METNGAIRFLLQKYFFFEIFHSLTPVLLVLLPFLFVFFFYLSSPLPSFFNEKCPLVCTKNIAACPEMIRPQCKASEIFCPNGECIANPQNLTAPSICPLTSTLSLCHCDSKSAKSNLDELGLWFPCVSVSTSRLLVNISSTAYRDKEQKLYSMCFDLLRSDPLLHYLKCDEHVPHFSYREPIWLSFWTVLSCQFLLLLFYVPTKWYLEYKQRLDWNKKNNMPLFHSKTQALMLLPCNGCQPISSSSQQEEYIVFYQNNMLGQLTYYMTLVYTVFVIIFLVLIIVDYYNTLDGFIWFFVHESLVPSTFVIIWHWMLLLLVVWKLKTPLAIRQFFRIRTANAILADYVVLHRRVVKRNLSPPPKKMMYCLAFLFRNLQRVGKWFDRIFQLSLQSTCHRVQLTKQNRIPYFYDTAMRYMYSSSLLTFRPHTMKLADSLGNLVQLAQEEHDNQGGLTLNQVYERLEWIGPNRIDFKTPSFLKLMGQELSGWFYIYQFVMLMVWYYFAYWPMALTLTIFIFGSSIIKSTVRYKAFNRIGNLGSACSKVTVLREKKMIDLEDTQLVPGDIIFFSSEATLTVDVLIIKGRVLVDESCITGESKPITKLPIQPDLYHVYDEVPLDLSLHHHHVVFAGATVLQAEKLAYGLVLTTQLHSSRGQLIQHLLRPAATISAFQDQIKVVILFLFVWGIFCFSIVIYFMWDGSLAPWFYAVFMITEVISPLLPAVLVAGQSVAATRLNRHLISCTDLERISLAGKTKYFCFDKTGTLTQSHLSFSRFVSHDRLINLKLNSSNAENSLSINDPRHFSIEECAGLLTCHSLALFEEKLIGNPVDLAMFSFVSSSSDSTSLYNLLGDMIVDSDCRPFATILHRFPFEHELQTMGVVVQFHAFDTSLVSNSTLTSSYTIFFKGAYEKIREKCKDVPSLFDEIWRKATKSGGYVLALATRKANEIPKLRHDAMHQLNFLGLLVFENQLKDDTKQVMNTLRNGGCETVMITGDALFTGVSVANDCGFFTRPSNLCIYGDVNEQSMLVWRDVETESEIQLEPSEIRGFDLAVTGAVWQHLTLHNAIFPYLTQIKVFARMAPEQKTQVIHAFMQLGVVAMCGDGANDCGALHAATVGIALNDCESALVAPFSTTSSTSLNACVRVLTEGRSALTSSFAGYKFLIMYGMTMSSMCLTMFYFNIVLPQGIWIFIDAVIVVVSCFTLTLAKSLNKLAPQRPTMNLLGVQTVCSIALHTFLHWSHLMLAIYFLFQQPWFLCNEFDSFAIDKSRWWLLGDNFESTVISTMAIFQFLNNGAIFNFGDRFRKAWYTNTFYVIFYLSCFVLMSWMVLSGPFYLNCLFRINCGNQEELLKLGYSEQAFHIPQYNSKLGHNVMPVEFRWSLWGLAMLNVLLCLILEKCLVLGLLRRFASKQPRAA